MIVNALWVALIAALLDRIGHAIAGTPARTASIAWHSFIAAILTQVLFYG